MLRVSWVQGPEVVRESEESFAESYRKRFRRLSSGIGGGMVFLVSSRGDLKLR